MDDQDTVSTVPGGPKASGFGASCVVQIYGDDLGRRYPITDELSVGRDDSNRVVLRMPSVSRNHARLYRKGLSCYVEDVGSTNGTTVNEVAVEGPVLLSNGDLIKVGGAVLKFIAGGNVEALYHEEIYRLTVHDGLTGIPNKRRFVEFLEREIARSARHHRPLSLAMLDLDHFKDLNDSFGHLAGDHVLERLARLISEQVRREHLFARYGGEEFVLVLPEVDLAGARTFCEKIRRLVEKQKLSFDGKKIRTTVSVGIATMQTTLDVNAFVKAADEQLYRAKDGGRNRVVAEGDPG